MSAAERKPTVKILSKDASQNLKKAGIGDDFDMVLTLRLDGSADVFVKQNADGAFHDVAEEHTISGTTELYDKCIGDWDPIGITDLFGEEKKDRIALLAKDRTTRYGPLPIEWSVLEPVGDKKNCGCIRIGGYVFYTP